MICSELASRKASPALVKLAEDLQTRVRALYCRFTTALDPCRLPSGTKLLEREEVICSRRGRRMKIAPYRQRISTGYPRARADGLSGATLRRAEACTCQQYIR